MARVTVTGINRELARVDAEVSAFITRNVRENTLAAFGDVVQATPVDTGQARRSWRVNETLNQAAGYFYAGQRVENTTDYIENLNEGSSQQAPARFIETSFMRYFDDVVVEVIPGELD